MTTNRMVGFGYKTGWLAIRDGSLPDVLETLGGRVVGAAAWDEGVNRASGEADIVVATPPLTGADGGEWLIVAGRWVASGHGTADVTALSAALGCEVQRFVTHRVVDLHSWERAIGGSSVRAFEYVGESGEVTRWHGDPDEVELAVGLPATYDVERGSGPEGRWFDVDEDDVMRVAAAWSLDPTTLEGQPATVPLTIAQVPLDAGRRYGPGHEAVAVDVTDLIMSSEPHKGIRRKVAARLRKARRSRNGR